MANASRGWELGLGRPVFPGLFWRPAGGGGAWMGKADDFPGSRPRLGFANSVKTNSRVDVPSLRTTEGSQDGEPRPIGAPGQCPCVAPEVNFHTGIEPGGCLLVVWEWPQEVDLFCKRHPDIP